MLIWSGKGIFVPFLIAGIFVLTMVISDTVGFPGDYAGLIGLLLAAVACWIIGRRLNNPNKDRLLTDEETGETVIVTHRHTLFWIEFQWWSIPSVIMAFARMV